MPKHQVLKPFAIEETAFCVNCNWEQPVLYVDARTDDEAYQLYQQNGGLCAECYMAQATERESSHAPTSV